MFGGVNLKDRADGGVNLGVHEHDILAVRERLEKHLGAEFHGTRRIDDHIDVLRASQEERVLRDNGLARSNRVLELPLRSGYDSVCNSRIAVGLTCALGPPIENCGHAHARNAVDDGVGQPLSHESGPEQPDPYRLARGGSRLQRSVNKNH